MSLTETILQAIKLKKAVFGYKKSIAEIKSGQPAIVVIAENIPEHFRKQIEHNVKIFGLKVEVFKGTSKELGVLCGKPFPISALVIKE